jgi:hypothetical protein
MHYREIPDLCLVRDQPLTDSAPVVDPMPIEDGHLLIDLVSDGRAELLDTLLQILLTVCLFSSFAVCGWKLANVSGPTADAHVALPAQPSAIKLTVSEDSARRTIGQIHGDAISPHISNPLTLSSKLF